MRNLFNSKHRVTQTFGVNSTYYAQFGLKGHEGLDLIPTGTVWDVLCLEDGVVVRDIDDATLGKNYGKNVTIWHPIISKATQYCHLAKNNVSMGQRLIKGDKIGLMGSTGNTTGAHVHLNLFEVDSNGIRLNRDNGYFGGIDPEPFLIEPEQTIETISVEKTKFEDFERVKSIYNKAREKLNIEDSETVFLTEIDKLIKYEDIVLVKEKQIVDANTKIAELAESLSEITETNTKLIEDNKILEIRVKEESKIIENQEDHIVILGDEIKQLKENVNVPIFSGWKRLIINLLSKI